MKDTRPFEWGMSSLTYRGERDCGDKCLVKTFTGGALVAVIDALGHGHQAAYAAEVAVRILVQQPDEHPVTLMERCHAAMRRTRGAAISLASFDWRQRIMTWLGVGNVAGVLLRVDNRTHLRPASLLVRGGTVGDQLPDLLPSIVPLASATTLIMATDGIRSDFTEKLPSVMEPEHQARLIIDGYARNDDDATVLVFRCSEGLQ